jgi:hypothetical protein
MIETLEARIASAAVVTYTDLGKRIKSEGSSSDENRPFSNAARRYSSREQAAHKRVIEGAALDDQ